MKVVILCTMLSLPFAPVAMGQQTTNSFDSTYGLLSDRNMFMRERHAPRPAAIRRPTRSNDDNTPQAIERAYVLRGVAIEDDALHAYLENTRTGEAVRVAPGDTLAGGRVKDIAIDAISYEADGKSAWIEVGENLSGVRTGPTTIPSAATQPDGVSAPIPPGGGTLEERMKLRRQQQRGGK